MSQIAFIAGLWIVIIQISYLQHKVYIFFGLIENILKRLFNTFKGRKCVCDIIIRM
jgi:hypothetical protein